MKDMDDLSTLKRLSTPGKIQDFLDKLPINHEKYRETCMSPGMVLKKKKAHCLEGALLAAAALWVHGEKPLLMNLKVARGDDDHAVALYRVNGYWGALSKTNHAVLRFRDPVYRTPRELAMSYFHEYFLATGRKTLQAYSKPFNLAQFGREWLTSKDDLWDIADALRDSPHIKIVPKGIKIRGASPIEREAGGIIEWPKGHLGT